MSDEEAQAKYEAIVERVTEAVAERLEDRPVTAAGPRTLTKAIQQDLLAPFDSDEIEWLPRAATGERALALPHIDARNVMQRLDAVVGPDGWNFTFDSLNAAGTQVKGQLTVLGSVREDAGESATEDEKLKSAVSDALKRCAVHFGIGRYLYSLPQIWAPYDPQRRRLVEKPRVNEAALLNAARKAGWTGGREGAAGQQNRQPAHQPSRRTDGGQGISSPPRESMSIPQPRPQPDGYGDENDVPVPDRNEPTPAPAATANGEVLECSAPGCGKPLTKGQHEVSMRAWNSALCPNHQKERKQQTRAD